MKNIKKLMTIGMMTIVSIIGIAQPAEADTKLTYTTSNCTLTVTVIDYETKEKITEPITETCFVTNDSSGGLGVSYDCPVISGYSRSSNTNSQVIKVGEGSYSVDMYYMKDGNYSPTGTWSQSNGYWNYITTKGIREAKVIGWIHPDAHWYHMDINGDMQTGWIKDKGNTYYLYNDGSMAIGWVKLDSKWHYMNTNGQMLSKITIDGYKLGEDGALL